MSKKSTKKNSKQKRKNEEQLFKNLLNKQIKTVRRRYPQQIANEILNVQPMRTPTGYAFALRYSFDEELKRKERLAKAKKLKKLVKEHNENKSKNNI